LSFLSGWSLGTLQFRSVNQGVVMTESNYLTQTQLAERWQVAESTLERWRS